MNKKAVALVFSFVVITVLTTLGTAMLSRSISERYIAQRFIRSSQSFWLAEAGTQRALWELNYGNGNWIGWTDTEGDKSISATLGESGDYYVIVANPTSENPTITSTGYAPNISDTNHIEREIEAVIGSASGSPFTYAAFGKTSLSMSGNGKTDSYNSDNGAYGGENISANGDIGTNAITSAAISLSGNATANGDAKTGENGAVSISGNAEVNGTITHDSAQTIASAEVPTSLISLSSSGNYSVSGNNHTTLPVGDYKFSSLSVSGNGSLTLQGPMNLYLTETTANALGVSGNGNIIITGAVKIYTEGKCSVSGNGITNTSNLPENLMLYSVYSGTDNGVSVSGNGDLYGAIYAPDTTVRITGNGDIFGAVIGNQVFVNGNGDIHYDEALADVNGSESNYAIWTWREKKNPYLLTP